MGLVGEGSNLALLQGQWELQMPMTYNVFPMPNYESYDIIQFTFRFKRNPEFYLIVLVVPSVLLGILPTLAFLIPVESGEKISLGLTTLLAQVVELLVLSDILPPSSRGDFPILGRLVIYSIVLIAVAILESIFVTCIYHVDPKTSLPWFVRSALSSPLMGMVRLPRLQFHKPSKVNPADVKDAKMHENVLDAQIKIKDSDMVENAWALLARLIDRIMFINYVLLDIVGSAIFCFCIDDC